MRIVFTRSLDSEECFHVWLSPYTRCVGEVRRIGDTWEGQHFRTGARVIGTKRDETARVLVRWSGR